MNPVIFDEKPVGALLFVCLGSVLTHTSVEYDPVSGLQSNRVLRFRTGSGLHWISKKILNRIRYVYMYNRIWITESVNAHVGVMSKYALCKAAERR